MMNNPQPSIQSSIWTSPVLAAPPRHAARDLPAVEVALALLLAVTADHPLFVWPVCGLVCLSAAARALSRHRSGKQVRLDCALHAAAGLVWGLYTALLVAWTAVPQAAVAMGLALLAIAAIPAVSRRRAQRLFLLGGLAPASAALLVQSGPESTLLGGLLAAFLMMALSLCRPTRRPARADRLVPGENDLLSRELRALAMRNSWRVIDGTDAGGRSEKQQFQHQGAQRRV